MMPNKSLEATPFIPGFGAGAVRSVAVWLARIRFDSVGRASALGR